MFTITHPRLTKRLFSQLVPWLFLCATAHAQTAWPRVHGAQRFVEPPPAPYNLNLNRTS
ncbi:MAG TPA: hypothetical protein VFW43_07290 [Polaromonas sp.]|nr:hypothetical protein [Polaromonas sp.]